MIGSKRKETNKHLRQKMWAGVKNFKCFMVNARSLSSINKSDELELYIKQNKLDIVCITKTWATENIWEI